MIAIRECLSWDLGVPAAPVSSLTDRKVPIANVIVVVNLLLFCKERTSEAIISLSVSEFQTPWQPG